MSRFALDLDGYEEQSIWGWDPPTSSYFASLYPNGSDEAVELSVFHDFRTCEALAAVMAQCTGTSLEVALAAMELDRSRPHQW